MIATRKFAKEVDRIIGMPKTNIDASEASSTVASNNVDASEHQTMARGESLEHLTACPRKDDPMAQCQCEVNGVLFRCVVCRTPFSRKDFTVPLHLIDSCPECGTELTGLHPNDSRLVKITWAELQLLSTWSECYISQQRDRPDLLQAIYSITGELESQFPMAAPLTIGRQLGQMQENKPGSPNSFGLIQAVKPGFRLQ